MAIKSRITTKGFEAYLEQLARAGRDVDADAGAALLAGGEILIDGMHRRVPKDTGNLDEHLVIDGPHQEGNLVYIDVGLIGADAETARYGNVQEFGSAYTAAQPYIRPTLDSDIGKARAAIRKTLEERGDV
jgi:HK97 gp10 family phage protein